MTIHSDLRIERIDGTDALRMDRRSNPALRVLVDDMMRRVRELNRNSGLWSEDECASAERELEMVMARVRRAAATRPLC